MDLVKTGIGIEVKAGAPKPDVSTVAAFKQTLLSAKSITYLKEGASTRHLVKVLAQLGIADALEQKTAKPATESVSEMVADGEVEIGIIVIPNILSVPGHEPPMQRSGMGDHVTGLAVAGMIGAALYNREKTGAGQLVSTSLLRIAAYQISSDYNMKLMLDTDLGYSGCHGQGVGSRDHYQQDADAFAVCERPV